MTLRPVLVAVIAVAGLSGLGACSGDDSAPSAPVADQVDVQVSKALGLDSGDVATACPDGVEAKKDVTFDCDLTIEEQTLTATVTFFSDQRFTYVFNGKVFLKAELLVALKRDAAGAMSSEVTELDCPGTTHTVIRTGETITCTGTNATGAKGKAIVGLDANGAAVIQKLTN